MHFSSTDDGDDAAAGGGMNYNIDVDDSGTMGLYVHRRPRVRMQNAK